MAKKISASQQPFPGASIGDRHPGLGTLTLEIDRFSSVSDQVHSVLRKAIVDVRLAPNERISENSICKQFLVSRTPVRAAIQRLAEEGLVDVSPQRGSFVAPLRLESLRDSHFVRRSLELALLRGTAMIWTPAMGDVMREIIAEQQKMVAAQDLDGFFAEDERFHKALVECSNHPGVWSTIVAAKTPLMRFHRYWAYESRLVDVLNEHRAIVDALDAGNAAEAEQALAQHLDMVFVIFDRMTDEEKAGLPFDVPGREMP